MARDEDELRAYAESLNITPAGQGMFAINELYVSLKDGGFTRLEALWIVGYLLSGGSARLDEEEK